MIRRGWVYEAVVVSGRNHAAPMGAIFTGADAVELEVYKTAETCRNIRDDGRFTLYFTDALTLGRVLEKKKLEGKRSYASLKVEVASIENLGSKIRFRGRIVSRTHADRIILVNRAEALYMEALIESTKPRPRKRKFDDILRVVSKVAPDSVYERMLKALTGKSR